MNTHVINELQNPIFVDGLKDVVVAACPDGILVCSKEHSEEIKKSVENLTPRPMYEERRWRTYRVLDDSYYADGPHIPLPRASRLKKAKTSIIRFTTIEAKLGLSFRAKTSLSSMVRSRR